MSAQAPKQSTLTPIPDKSAGIAKGQAQKGRAKPVPVQPEVLLSDMVIGGEKMSDQDVRAGAHAQIAKDVSEEEETLGLDPDLETKPQPETASHVPQEWTLAQANTAMPGAAAAATDACKTPAKSAQECDDDKGGLWGQQDAGAWLKLGLGAAAVMLAAQPSKDKDETISLQTAMASGPFKKNGMTLSYVGTNGLLLELSWDALGNLTKTVNTPLNGEVVIHYSKVNNGTALVEVITGVELDFANYTGTLMAVLWDKNTDAVSVEYYDEVAGLIKLENAALRAVTTIQKGPNYLAITPFTELALRMAGVAELDLTDLPAFTPAVLSQVGQVLNSASDLSDIREANQQLSAILGVTDIVQVLPVAMNDEAFQTTSDVQAKLYGEKLASLSRLVPGNLEGGLEKLLAAVNNERPDTVKQMMVESLQDYRDDNNPQNPVTPPEVTILRPWINAAEGLEPVTIRGRSEFAQAGSLVRLTVLKNGVELPNLNLKALVDAEGLWLVTLPATLASMGVQEGDTLTVRAYINPDHTDSVDIRYDATPPGAPQNQADMLASDDSGNDSDNLTSQTRPGFQIGSLPEEGMTVQLLVDGEPVQATYDALTGVLRPSLALGNGAQNISFRYIDFAGNVGGASAPLLIDIDSNSPTAVLQSPSLSNDSGTSSTDGITQVAAQTIRGTLSSSLNFGETLRASMDNGVTWVDITSSVNGTSVNWRDVTLPLGSSTLRFQVIDAAGNPGPTVSQRVLLDTTAPASATQAPDLQAASDSLNNDDNITRISRPVFDIQDRPVGAVATEMLVNGTVVAAIFKILTNTMQTNADLADGTHQVSYRFIDAAGNRSDASPALTVTVDTRAPASTLITTVAVGGFTGTYELGSTVSLSIAGVPVTGTITTLPDGSWRYVPSNAELDAMRAPGAISELLLTVTDAAGNAAKNSRTVTADDLSGPYIKEFIPADGTVLANDDTGHATLNLVFSKPVTKGATGTVKLYDMNDNLLATVPVNSSDVRIEGEAQNDIYVNLPGLTLGLGYYVTIDAGAFKDSNQEAFAGQVATGVGGWNFTAVAASIAPDFVAADDMINAQENTAVVSVTGAVVSSTPILAAITTADFSISVRDANNAPVPATITGYTPSTGAFTFSVAANAWREGAYSYTVELEGRQGAAQGINASYAFSNLVVDLTAPTMRGELQGALDDAGRLTGELWASNAAVSDDTSPYLSGTLSAQLTDDARVVVYRRDVTDPNNPGALVKVTGPEGLKPTGLSWSVGDRALQDGHRYEYVTYVEDAAGNRSQASTVKTLLVDTSPPTAQVTGLAFSQDTGLSTSDRITNVASQTLSGNLNAPLGSGETLRASMDGGITWTDITSSVNGSVFAWAGVSLTAGAGQVRFQVQDAAGNLGPVSQLAYTLDQSAPAAPTAAPDLHADSDSGSSSSDDITRETRPYLAIDDLPQQVAGAQLLVNGEVVDATYNANDGTLRPTNALTHGEYSLTYRWVDTAGNIGAAGPALGVQIDTIAPSLRVTNIDISADSGSSSSDFITRTPAQTITGQLNGALASGDRVEGSLDGGSTWINVTNLINAGGQINGTAVTLLEGNSSVQFRVVDVAGNIGPISRQDYSLDLTAPETMVRNIDISADTGISASDFITKEATQTVTGRLMDGDELQALQPGDRLWASSNGGTSWQDITSTVSGNAFTWVNVNLTNGASSLQFKVIDAAGNEGGVSRQNYTLDMVAPAAPQNFAWATYPNGINTGGNSVSGLIGNVPFTYTLTSPNNAPINLNSSTELANHSYFPVGFGVPNQTSIRNDFTSINKLTFDTPLSNPVLAFSSIGSPSVPVSIQFPQPVEILWSTGYGTGPDVRVDVGTRSAASQVTGWEGNMVVRLNGTVSEFQFNYLSPETYVNFAFGAAVFDLLSPEQDSGIKSIDDITQVTRPNFKLQNMPSDAVSAELLIDGRPVDATFNSQNNFLTPNLPLADGVYQVSYRYVDVAGNASAAGSVTQVTIDTRAPVNTSLITFTPTTIGGTYERGTTLSLKVNGVDIAPNRIVLNPDSQTWSLAITEDERTTAGTGLLNKATSTFDLTATDLAGNVTLASKTVSKDVFNAPYIKEFIPGDDGILANDTTDKATLNLVFSKAVQAGTGKIKLFNEATNALVAEIDVTSNAVQIENGSDVYVTLPGLTTGVRYYVTLDAGTFVDSANQGYVGKSETGTSGWDFTGALASIAPDFVAQDDIININENAAVVRITGKVVSSAPVLEDIVLANLTVSVSTPQGADAITATLQSYNKQTGEFVFTVPARAWTNGNYGYTVNLQGSAGDASGVSASYNFANLAVDLVAPTGIASSIDSIVDNAGQTQGNLFTNSLKLLESGFALPSGTTVVTDVNVADLELSRLSITMGGAWVSNGQPSPGTYNSGSTVYNAERTSVTFWVQGPATQAVQLKLTDTASGIELKIIDAKSGPAELATTHNWNIGDPQLIQQQTVATSPSGDGYGVSGLEYLPSWKLLESGFAPSAQSPRPFIKLTDINVTDLDLTKLSAIMGGAWIGDKSLMGGSSAVYNSASTVYNSDRTSVTFWLQTRDDSNGVIGTFSKAIKVELKDSVNPNTNGIEIRVIEAAYKPYASTDLNFNWNNSGAPKVGGTVTTSFLVGGYGLIGLEFVGGNMSPAMLGNAITDDNTPTLSGTLTRALAQDERISVDRTDGDDNTVTITGKAGLIVDGTTWTVNDGILADGQYTYRVYVEDAAGNRTASSPARTIMVDTQAPTAVVTVASLSQDTGVSSTDRLTKVAAQTITGTLSAALGSGEKLMASFDGGTTFVDITSMVSGTSFNWTGVTLRQGSNAIRWQVVDAMGNRGTNWEQTFTLDTTGPAVPTVASLTVEGDEDKILTGTAVLAEGDSLSVQTNGAVYQVVPNVQGVWTLNLTTATPSSGLLGSWSLGKAYDVLVTVTDRAGNSAVDNSMGEIQTVAPVSASSVMLNAGSGSPPAPVTRMQIAKFLGDVNGDGFDDVGLNKATFYQPNVPINRILFGSANYAALVSLKTLESNQSSLTNASPWFSSYLASTGDLNNDGKSDVAMAYMASNDGNFPLEVKIFNNILPSTGGITSNFNIVGGKAVSAFNNRIYHDWLGMYGNMEGLGDVNGDGFSDLLIGAPGTNVAQAGNYPGQAYILFGSTSQSSINLNSGVIPNGFKVASNSLWGNTQWGQKVSSAGDFNGDGLSDFLIQNNQGAIRLIYGKKTSTQITIENLTKDQGISIDGLPAELLDSSFLRTNIFSNLGDFNGDGFSDIALSNHKDERVYILLGGNNKQNTNLVDIASQQGINGYTISGLGADDQLGWNVSYAGDFNGDGLNDLIISAPQADSTGKVYVVYGKNDRTEIRLQDISQGVGGFEIGTNVAGATRFGDSVTHAGDANGDGLDDLLVSFYLASSTPGKGFDSYLYLNNGKQSGSKVTQTGGSGNDTMNDGGVSATLVAGLGNDALSASAASVLYGGAGDDVFTIKHEMARALESEYGLGGNIERLSRIDGGSGVDTLRLDGTDLDLSLVANQAASSLTGGSRIDGIEVIDLSAAGRNTVKLNLLDVIDMGSANTFETTARQQLMIKGGAGDTVQLMDTNATSVWTKAADTVTLDGAQYHVINHNTAAATLYVQVGVAVTDFVAGAPAVQVIDPAWAVNTSRLTIDYSSADKSGWIDADVYENNTWDSFESYKTDNNDVFSYDFGRIIWDEYSTSDGSTSNRWELKNWQIGLGDRIQGATVLNEFDGSQLVAVPSSFGGDAGGDDQVRNDQFEVFYGTLVNGVFTVTSTEEFTNSQTELIGGATSTLAGATHTLILFDNDTQSRSSNTLNDLLAQSNHASYRPDQGYSQAYGGSEVYLSHPYWLEAAVVSGVYHEKGWSLSKDADGTNQKLGWKAPPDYISIGRLDAEANAFGAWFDTDKDGVFDDGEDTIELSNSGSFDPDAQAFSYSYTLSHVDFAAGNYTVRFVDPVMFVEESTYDEVKDEFIYFNLLKVPENQWDFYSPLNLDEMAFRNDDLLIIDKRTNADAWTDWQVEGLAGDQEVTLSSAGVGVDTAIAHLGLPIVLNDNLTFLV